MILLKFLLITGVFLSDYVLGMENSFRGLKKKNREACSLEPVTADVTGDCVVPLMAGQHEDVGEVHVTCEKNKLVIHYTLAMPYIITEAHFYIGADAPKRQAPGQLGHTYEGNEIPKPTVFRDQDTFYSTYSFETDEVCDSYSCPVIAAHAVVESMHYLEQVNHVLPEGEVWMNLQRNVPDSYWKWSGSIFGEDYVEAWCVDVENTISGGNRMVTLHSSYDDDFDNVIYPENFPMVNWILNEDFVGKKFVWDKGGDDKSCGDSDSDPDMKYTYGDVQRAIWILLENNGVSSNGLGSVNACCYNQILRQAEQHSDFVPECGDVIGIIIDPVDTASGKEPQIIMAQITMATIGVECEPTAFDETAWAIAPINKHCDFGQGWGSYFMCCL